MYPVKYDLEYYRLPERLEHLLNYLDADAEKAYLGVVLAVLTTFTTYYAFTLSIELYWSIVSVCPSLYKSTLSCLCSSGRSIDPVPALFQNIVPLPSMDDLSDACTSQSPSLSEASCGGAFDYPDDRFEFITQLTADQTASNSCHRLAACSFEEAIAPEEDHGYDARGATGIAEPTSHSLLDDLRNDVQATSGSVADQYGDSCERDTRPDATSEYSTDLDASCEGSPFSTRSVLLLPVHLSSQDLEDSGESLQSTAALEGCLSLVIAPVSDAEVLQTCVPSQGSTADQQHSLEELYCEPVSSEEPLSQAAAEMSPGPVFENSAVPLAQALADVPAPGEWGEAGLEGETRSIAANNDRADDAHPACIMESAVLVQDSRVDEEGAESGWDTDYDFQAEWTPVDRRECGLERELFSRGDDAFEGCPDAPGPSNEILAAVEDSVEVPRISLTHGENAAEETLEHSQLVSNFVQAPSLSVIVECAPPEERVPSSEPLKTTLLATPDSTIHLTLPVVTNGHTPSTSAYVDVEGPSEVYIGPLPSKPPRERKHTPQNPDWAIAPQPKVKKHRRRVRRPGKGPYGKVAGDGGRAGDQKEGKEKKGATGPGPSSRRERSFGAQGKKREDVQVEGVAARRRSAQLAQA
ncbi:hypothetical protein BV20DRAFT_967141 [Pilatotrama ljubarskyi]|nr:hypothetical protein BV20DRAFT_967141 [Pilatotrama ljubarskyi]